MIDYGRQLSNIKPDSIEITETKVFTANNIVEVIEDLEGTETIQYEFTLKEFSKDEYIKFNAEQQKELEEELNSKINIHTLPKIKASTDRQDFLEELIAEMAMKVYE